MNQYEIWRLLSEAGRPMRYTEIVGRFGPSESEKLAKLMKVGYIRKVELSNPRDRRSCVAYEVVPGLKMDPPRMVEL